tara:strand:+ start:315 stop:521 length:207 start_codon:yes stop_codon:yes gene_type:complete
MLLLAYNSLTTKYNVNVCPEKKKKKLCSAGGISFPEVNISRETGKRVMVPVKALNIYNFRHLSMSFVL